MSAASKRALELLADRKLYGAHEAWEGATLGSPGLLATLAGEVERLEKHERDCAGIHRSPVFVDKTGMLPEVVAENTRLRDALEGLACRNGAEPPCWCDDDLQPRTSLDEHQDECKAALAALRPGRAAP